MALNNMGMGITFTARDLASNVINDLAKNFLSLDDAAEKAGDAFAGTTPNAELLTKSLRGLAVGATVAAAGMAGLTLAFSLAEPAGKFEQVIAGIGQIAKATSGQLKSLEDAAIRAGIETQFSPVEAAKGLEALAKAGLSADESMRVLQPALDLAAGSLGELGVESAAQLATQAMRGFGVESANVGLAVDKMLSLTQSFNISARELPLAMGIGARGAQALSASLDDVAISLGLAKNVMPSVERASTSVAVAMERLSTAQAQSKLETLFHTQAVDKATGKFRPWLDVVGDMLGAMDGMTEAQRSANLQAIFGARAAGGMNAILTQLSQGVKSNTGETLKGAAAIKYFRDQMAGSEGTARSFRDALLDTFEGQKTLLRGTMETIGIAVGKPFAQVLKPLVKGFTDALNNMLQLFQAMPDTVKRAFAGFFVAGSLTAVFVGLGIAITALVPLIKAMAGAAMIAALPFIKIAAVVAAVVAGLWLMKKAWDANFMGIRGALLPVLEQVSLALSSIFALVTTGKIEGDLASRLLGPGMEGVLSFVQLLTTAWANVRAFSRGVIGVLAVVGKRLSDAFKPTWKALGEALKSVLSAINTVGVAVAKAFGLEQTEAGIDSIETLGGLLTAIATGPLVLMAEGFANVAFGLAKVVEGSARVIDFLAGAVGPLAKVLGGAFDVVFGAITLNFKKVTEGVAKMVNGVVDAVNLLISNTQKLFVALGQTDFAVKLEGLKLDQVSAGQVDFALTGDTAALIEEKTAKDRDAIRAPSPLATRPTNIQTATEGGAQIQTQRGQALSAADVSALLDAFERRTEAVARGQPIVVQGEVAIDGRRLGEVRAQDARDQRARVGSMRQSFGR